MCTYISLDTGEMNAHDASVMVVFDTSKMNTLLLL